MSEFGTGKTIFVLAIVVGCFAVLWPKVFYPMLSSAITDDGDEQLRTSSKGGGLRPERPRHLHPDMMHQHPALRDKGRALPPQRTIEKQARPGPMPGIRPPMGGGAGHIASPHGSKGASSMSVIMPLYTVGIIIFFIYTIMKVLFKKHPEDEDDKMPKLKDFHLDPEYRKYVFEEEYLDSGNSNDSYSRYRGEYGHPQEKREKPSLRKRGPSEHSEPKLAKTEDEHMDQLRRRLEDTEKAMEKLMTQMGSVSDKLTAAKITEVLSQAQTQAKLLKNDDAGKNSSKGSSPDMDSYEIVQKGNQQDFAEKSSKENEEKKKETNENSKIKSKSLSSSKKESRTEKDEESAQDSQEEIEEDKVEEGSKVEDLQE